MRTLQIVQCQQCARYLELEVGDLTLVKHLPTYYDTKCHRCGSLIRLRAEVAMELFPEASLILPEPPAAKQRKNTEEGKKELDLAYAAGKALKQHKTQAKTASALGITQKELRARLSMIPELTGGEV